MFVKRCRRRTYELILVQKQRTMQGAKNPLIFSIENGRLENTREQNTPLHVMIASKRRVYK
jgi:hypothetical protein